MTQSITEQKRKTIRIERDKRIKKLNEYYADISLAIKMDSNLSLEEILSKYSIENMKVQLVLKPHEDDTASVSEVLEVWGIDWEEWSEF